MRSWARTGKPVVKEFEDEFFVRHALVLDTFTENPYSEIFEEAGLGGGFLCLRDSNPGIVARSFIRWARVYCCTAGRGLAHTDQMLEILASVRACTDQSFGAWSTWCLITFQPSAVAFACSWHGTKNGEGHQKLKAVGVPYSCWIIAGHSQTALLDPGPMRDEPIGLRF